MARQHSQYGNEPQRGGRERGYARDFGPNEEYRRGQRFGEDQDRDYSRNQGGNEGNAPLEWDDRQYGRDFNDNPNDGGRGIYGSERGRDRSRGGSYDYGNEQGNYGGRSSGAQQYGSQSYGSQGGRQQAGMDDPYRGGRANYSSSKYGGSDYQSTDYERNQSRYGSPYREQGDWQQLSDERGTQDRWTGGYDQGRVQTRPEFGQGNQGRFGEGAGTEYGRSAYGQLYGQSSAQGSYGDQYEGSNYGQGGAGRSNYGSSGYGYGTSGYGQSFGVRGEEASGRGQSRQFGPAQGQSTSQSFRGKGPKGYQRSDERLKEIVCEALSEDDEIDASNISVEVKNKEIKLTGSINDRRMKYLVEELVERKTGCEVQNELRVRSESQSERGQGASGSTQTSSIQNGSSQGAQQASAQGSGQSQRSTLTGGSVGKESEGGKDKDKSGKST